MNIKTTTVIAATAAAFFLASPVITAGTVQAAQVKCVGGNACKGTSACKSATNECKGQNACKGQGFTMTGSAEECTKAGGKPAS